MLRGKKKHILEERDRRYGDNRERDNRNDRDETAANPGYDDSHHSYSNRKIEVSSSKIHQVYTHINNALRDFRALGNHIPNNLIEASTDIKTCHSILHAMNAQNQHEHDQQQHHGAVEDDHIPIEVDQDQLEFCYESINRASHSLDNAALINAHLINIDSEIKSARSIINTLVQHHRQHRHSHTEHHHDHPGHHGRAHHRE